MPNPRELILARLFVVLDEIPYVQRVTRNVPIVNDSDLPGISILEGDEEANQDDPIGRQTIAPRIVHMTPQIVLRVGTTPEALGPDINDLWAEVMRDVLTDAPLAALTLNGHRIRYQGMESDLGMGRTMLGQMAMRFTFTYLLNPSDL